MCNGERPTRLTPHEPLSAAGTPLQTATGKPQSPFEFGSKARESISAREPPARHAPTSTCTPTPRACTTQQQQQQQQRLKFIHAVRTHYYHEHSASSRHGTTA